jgi:hypothetical protein
MYIFNCLNKKTLFVITYQFIIEMKNIFFFYINVKNVTQT